MFDMLIQGKRLNIQKLVAYGFSYDNHVYVYKTNIMQDEFELTIQIKQNGEMDTELLEVETKEPYILYKTKACGNYVQKIRSEIEEKLCTIVTQCYEADIFQHRQAKAVIAYCKDVYQDELEFLWAKFPSYAVLRRKDHQTWYAVFMRIKASKLGTESDDLVEIVDLRMDPNKADEILAQKHYYPGWHMNKKSWYTLVFNETLLDDEIIDRIQESYQLAK